MLPLGGRLSRCPQQHQAIVRGAFVLDLFLHVHVCPTESGACGCSLVGAFLPEKAVEQFGGGHFCVCVLRCVGALQGAVIYMCVCKAFERLAACVTAMDTGHAAAAAAVAAAPVPCACGSFRVILLRLMLLFKCAHVRL